MSEDLIKRSDVAEVVYKAIRTPPLKGVLTDTMSLAIALVRDIPSADRPQGEWEDTGKDPDHSHPLTAIWYKCSECGDGTNTKTNYCPNCGARMKGADDE